MLAGHFDQGEVWDKAVEYMVRAGTKNWKNHALQPAQQFLARAKEILQQNQPKVSWRIEFDLLSTTGLVLLEVGQFVTATPELEQAREIAQREGRAF